jgi:hypothetical protein
MADADRATAALRTALDASKDGASPDSLKTSTPPIHVSDSEWASGNKLIDYSIESGQTAGFGWRCDVLLTVEEENGRTRQHRAMYRIDTDPAVVVVHEE